MPAALFGRGRTVVLTVGNQLRSTVLNIKMGQKVIAVARLFGVVGKEEVHVYMDVQNISVDMSD